MIKVSSTGISRKGSTPIFHTVSRVIMRASVACRIRTDRKSSSGTAAVYLQIIINSERTTVPMGVSWPVDRFDNRSGTFMERHKGDQEASDYNIQIQKEKSKINDILMYYRHSDLDVSVSRFKQDYERYDYRHLFLPWMREEVESRFGRRVISKNTRKGDISIIKNLSGFKSDLRFSEIDAVLLEEMEGYYRQKELSLNTIHRYIKRFIAYVILAEKRGMKVNLKSLEDYNRLQPTSRIVFLNSDELTNLEGYYDSVDIPEDQRKVLGYFLFCCCTGLRYSDLVRLNQKNLDGDLLTFEMHKGHTKRVKEVVIPLTKRARGYIANRTGRLFDTISEQKTNAKLKVIMLAAGVRKHVTTHVARHTFATQFLRKGGHLEVLQKLLAHDNIQSTMIYVHVDTDRLQQEMKFME